MSKWQDDNTPENLTSLEERLAGTLRPITPSKDIVKRLRDRIHFPERDEIINRLRDWNRLFLVFTSVMSGMMLLITVARALYYIVGRRKIA